MADLALADLFDRAADRLVRGRCRGFEAVAAGGEEVWPYSEDAVAWCASGALIAELPGRELPSPLFTRANDILTARHGSHWTTWWHDAEPSDAAIVAEMRQIAKELRE